MSTETIDLIQVLRKNKDTKKNLVEFLKNNQPDSCTPMELNRLAKKTLKDYTKTSSDYIDYFDEYERLVKNLYGRKTGVYMNDIILAETEAILITLSQTRTRLTAKKGSDDS